MPTTVTNAKLVELLIDERNRQFTHSQHVKLQTFLTIAAGMFAVAGTKALPITTLCTWPAACFLIFTVLGLFLLATALVKHTRLHNRRFRQLETAISTLMALPEQPSEHDELYSKALEESGGQFFDAEPDYTVKSQSKPRWKQLLHSCLTWKYLHHDLVFATGMVFLFFAVIALKFTG